MKTSFISNLSVQSSMRATINQIQGELIDSQREVVSGRYSNLGEVLGATTTRSLNLHRDLSMMENLTSTNAIVSQRLSSTQMALETISNAAQTGLQTLVALAGSTDKTQLGTAVQSLSDVLDQFTDAANTSVNGEYVLAGINTDMKPVADYLTDEAGARSLLQGEIASRWGTPDITVTPADMEDFLTNVIEPMFMSGTDWNTVWSSASDTPVTSRISKAEVVQTSTTANASGFRNLAMAAVIGIELLNADLTSDTRAVVSNWAIGKMGLAIDGVDGERSLLGLSENRVTIANDTLQAQIDIIRLNLDDLEGVDVYEASTRITALTNQMEISYNLTARIAELSLVNEL